MKSYKFESDYEIVFNMELTDNEERKLQKYVDCFEDDNNIIKNLRLDNSVDYYLVYDLEINEGNYQKALVTKEEFEEALEDVSLTGEASDSMNGYASDLLVDYLRPLTDEVNERFNEMIERKSKAYDKRENIKWQKFLESL